MSSPKRAAVMFTAQTKPRFIEAYLNHAIVEVSEKQVVITASFDDFPVPELSESQTFISRDPTVVAFHQRVYAAIQKRHAMADAQVAEREGRAA